MVLGCCPEAAAPMLSKSRPSRLEVAATSLHHEAQAKLTIT